MYTKHFTFRSKKSGIASIFVSGRGSHKTYGTSRRTVETYWRQQYNMEYKEKGIVEISVLLLAFATVVSFP